MTKSAPWFVEERAVAFALLVLTRRSDVLVRAHADSDLSLDLLVEVLKDGKSTLRFFGVQLVAFVDLPDVRTADGLVLSHRPGDRGEATLPVCVFVIGVRQPEGIYRWVAQPVLQEGRALLRRDPEGGWQPLDDAGVARLIGQVNAWYDALNGNHSQKRRDRPARTEP